MRIRAPDSFSRFAPRHHFLLLPVLLFPRLVLGWIEADFRVQIRILQHFSKSTRKSSSREQILQISAKKLENFAKIFDICKILNFEKKKKKKIAKFSEIREILQKFADFFAEFLQNFLQNFTEICRF